MRKKSGWVDNWQWLGYQNLWEGKEISRQSKAGFPVPGKALYVMITRIDGHAIIANPGGLKYFSY